MRNRACTPQEAPRRASATCLKGEGIVIRVLLTNFNMLVYRGECLNEARNAAERTGFECSIFAGENVFSWSPIGGWRRI